MEDDAEYVFFPKLAELAKKILNLTIIEKEKPGFLKTLNLLALKSMLRKS